MEHIILMILSLNAKRAFLFGKAFDSEWSEVRLGRIHYRLLPMCSPNRTMLLRRHRSQSSWQGTHHLFKIVALLDDMPGEVFFAIPFSAVGFLEDVELVVKLQAIIH